MICTGGEPTLTGLGSLLHFHRAVGVLNSLTLLPMAHNPSAGFQHQLCIGAEDEASVHWDFSFSSDAGRKLLSADDYEYADDDDTDESDFFIAPRQQKSTPGFKTSRKRGKATKSTQAGIGKYEGDKVFDERTRRLVHDMIAEDNLRSVESLAFSGREFNLYFGLGHMYNNSAIEYKVALKIFKTPKASEPTHNASKSDMRASRNSVQRQLNALAEREFDSLAKAQLAGVSVPSVHLLNEHIVVMDFIGSSDGVPAPTVNAANLNRGILTHIYQQVLLSMRRLYQKARLVHGNLGEDTILVHEPCDWGYRARMYLVNFAHSVDRSESAHIAALERDIKHVQALFKKCGLVPSHALNGLWDDKTVRRYVTVEKTSELWQLLDGCYRGARIEMMDY